MKKLVFFSLIFFSHIALAQIGTSSGSLSYTRDAANSSGYSVKRNSPYGCVTNKVMPDAQTFIIEDYINYHLHDITIPYKEDVALSIDYDNNLSGKDEFILQIGIATQPANLRSEKQNKVNASLVVDVSGSMDGMKISSAKEALRRFARSLNNGDYLSIVLFNEKSWVAQPSVCLSGNRDHIYSIINRIEAGGGTNLNAGMMLGYKEAMKNHAPNMNSRVIMLTDGQTNTGETNVKNIVNNSLNYNREGIEISTIGVGQSLDFALLRELSEKGKGSNYFIGENEEDMCKVFNEELDAMMYNIGKNPELKINLPHNWEVLHCYGYKPKPIGKSSVALELNNLGASSTRIILLKIKKNCSDWGNVSAEIKYRNRGGYVSVKEDVVYNSRIGRTKEEIGKNFDIAFMAQNLKDAALGNNKQNYSKSEMILNNTLKWMKDSPNFNDPDFKRVYDIVESYAPEKNNREEYTEQPYYRY